MSSDNFDLEKYGENDEVLNRFEIKIPEVVEDGDYKLKATVFYEGGDYSIENDLIVECSGLELDSSEIEQISFGVDEEVKSVRGNKRIVVLIFGLLSMFIILIYVLLTVLRVF